MPDDAVHPSWRQPAPDPEFGCQGTQQILSGAGSGCSRQERRDCKMERQVCWESGGQASGDSWDQAALQILRDGRGHRAPPCHAAV